MPFSVSLDFVFPVILWNFPDAPVNFTCLEVESLRISHNPYHSCIRHGRWLLIDHEVLLSWRICYYMMWERIIGPYHIVFIIFFFNTTWRLFIFCFLSRQTWLRGPHAAPTIEDYWPIFFFIAYSLDPGACIRRCMYAHNVRTCTLYVGQQVCACLHPVDAHISK